METTIRAKIYQHELKRGVTNGTPWTRLSLGLMREVKLVDKTFYSKTWNFVCWNELAESIVPYSKDQLFEITYKTVSKSFNGITSEVKEIIACKQIQAV
jgi:hypothetical protein